MQHHPSLPLHFYVRAGELSVMHDSLYWAVDWRKNKKNKQSHLPQGWGRNHSLQKLFSLLTFLNFSSTFSGRFLYIQQLFWKSQSRPQARCHFTLFPHCEHVVIRIIYTGTFECLVMYFVVKRVFAHWTLKWLLSLGTPDVALGCSSSVKVLPHCEQW